MHSSLDHKALTDHIRGRIKFAGISVRCKMQDHCGWEVIYVSTTGPAVRFSDDEQRAIRRIAEVNGLTRAQGMEIDVDQMTDPFGMAFYMPVR